MNITKSFHGFTLLEVIIVIIIVGVLASLALPRMGRLVEGSRAAEALSTISQIRGAMEQCYLMRNRSFASCQATDLPGGLPPYFGDVLVMDDPSSSPNAHFWYSVGGGVQNGYCITVFRNDNGYNGAEPNSPYAANCETFTCQPVLPWRARSLLHACHETNGTFTIKGYGFYSNVSQ